MSAAELPDKLPREQLLFWRAELGPSRPILAQSMGDGSLQAIEALQAQLTEQAAALASLQHDPQAATLAKAGVTPADVEWKVLTSAFVFMMQLGFAMVESGMCRQVNVITTYAKKLY